MYKRQDRMGPIDAEVRRNVNGLPLNPVTRKYPRNYIHTGISAIDGLTTLIRGCLLYTSVWSTLISQNMRYIWKTL